MSEYEGKKNETVTVKVSIEQLKDFDLIAEKTDRSRSYVVRELAIRGLEQYKQDGLLKTGVGASFRAEVKVGGKISPKVSAKTSLSKRMVSSDEDMGLPFSGEKRKPNKQKQEELNKLMDEAIDKVKKSKK